MPRLPLMLLVLAVVTPLLATAAAAQEDMGKVYNRAMQLYRSGAYDAALPEFQKALEIAEARYGDDSPLLSLELNNLGEVYRRLGRHGAAEGMFKRAIALDEESRDDSDPGLATSLNNLALLYRTQKRMPEAEALYTRSLALLEQALGSNHPDVARSLNNLAVLYKAEGKPDEARPLLERAVSVAEASLGPSHATTKLFQKNLAALPPPSEPERLAVVAPTRGPAPGKLPPPPSAQVAALPRVAPAAAVTPGGKGGFALHLGSVRSSPDVAKEWRRLGGRHAELAGLELRPPQSVEVAGKGVFYRVLGGRFASRSQAQTLCSRLKARGVTCSVVAL